MFVQQAIAVLDSGVGGLTVVKEVLRQLPQEKVIYFGDTARTPYGPRSPEEVLLFTQQIVDYLLQFQPKMIVIACNTATAVALEAIRSSVPVPVIGVVHPGARAAISTTRSGIVGVIGTEGTIRSRAYEEALRKIAPNIQPYSLACPSFVPLVEAGRFDVQEAHDIVAEALAPLMKYPIDTLILGCTHYPFLWDTISDVVGPSVTLISSADETAREVSTVLHHSGHLAAANEHPVHEFFCSGDPALFREIAENWLGDGIEVHQVSLQVPQIL